MADNLLKSQAFKLKGRLFTLTVMQVFCDDVFIFEQYLNETIQKAPRLFDNTPIVIDCTPIPNSTLNLDTLCNSLRHYHVMPIAIQGANAHLVNQAQKMGLAILNASSSQDKSIMDNPIEEPLITPTRLLTTPVRSGQQVVGKGGDLVITASVSHGAELLADGNIHVYGALRGRALAGMSGDKQARIFCQSLEAELVSIAGFYRLSDTIQPIPGPCQIYLQDEHIQIEPL